jgi:hypothetical protein
MYEGDLHTVQKYPSLMQPCMLRLSREWHPSNRSSSCREGRSGNGVGTVISR